MKILHIIDSGGLYGAEVVLLNLVAEQIKQGLDPTIASIGEKHIQEKPLEAEALKRGFKVKKFGMRPGPNYLGAMKVLKFAHKADFDIMHSHGYKGNILFGFIPKSIRKIPMVSTIHGWTSTNNSFSKIRLYEWLDSKSLKYIDAVILVSKAMKSHPRLENLNGIKFHVIPNGIPIPETQFNNSTNQPFNQNLTQQTQATQSTQVTKSTQLTQQTQLAQRTLSTQQTLDQSIIDFCSKGFTIGSIGRLSTEKGYKYLIEAFALLVKKGIDARLIIIGEGYERDYLEGLVAQFEVTDRVMLPGYREDAKQYLSYFNVFVISSLTEGLPITLLEAMHARVPVVATEVGSIRDVLQNGKAGILIQPCSAEAIAQTTERLFHGEKLFNTLTASAYHRVTTCYSSKAMAMEYLNVYNRFI